MLRTYIHHQELATILLNYHIDRIVRNTDTTPSQPHRNSNTHRTKINVINVVIQQNSRKLMMIDILMSETCWAHKKWNKIVTSSRSFILQLSITMMHSPINIKKNQLVALISQIYFWNKTLHTSDSSSVHHQEFFFTVHTAMVYVIEVCWQLAHKLSAKPVCISVCTVKKLPMMDRGTVRNM